MHCWVKNVALSAQTLRRRFTTTGQRLRTVCTTCAWVPNCVPRWPQRCQRWQHIVWSVMATMSAAFGRTIVLTLRCPNVAKTFPRNRRTSPQHFRTNATKAPHVWPNAPMWPQRCQRSQQCVDRSAPLFGLNVQTCVHKHWEDVSHHG